MTQTLNAENPTTAADFMLALALDEAAGIPVTGGGPNGIGGHYASYGPLIQIRHDLRVGDPRGNWPLGATVGDTYVTPGDAARVLERLLDEEREIIGFTAVRCQLGGTTTV